MKKEIKKTKKVVKKATKTVKKAVKAPKKAVKVQKKEPKKLKTVKKAVKKTVKKKKLGTLCKVKKELSKLTIEICIDHKKKKGGVTVNVKAENLNMVGIYNILNEIEGLTNEAKVDAASKAMIEFQKEFENEL